MLKMLMYLDPNVPELLRSSDSKRKLCHYQFNKHQQRYLLSKQNTIAQDPEVSFQKVNIHGYKGTITTNTEPTKTTNIRPFRAR